MDKKINTRRQEDYTGYIYTESEENLINPERKQAMLGQPIAEMAEKDVSAALSLSWYGDVEGRTSEAGQMTEQWVARVLRYSSQYDNEGLVITECSYWY